MSFINIYDYPVNFSENIGDVTSDCPSTLTEKSATIFTENGLIIQQDCIPDRYICSGTCAREESTGSFTITNTCALPMTITGFLLDDPDTFSIFSSSYNTDRYELDICDELPITIQPYEAVDIPTFFKPSITALENVGEERATLNNRVGQKFNARLEIFPGFPVFNIGDAGFCNTYTILSGEFICEDKEKYDYSWTGNTDNFSEVIKSSLFQFNIKKYYNTFTLKRTIVFNSSEKNNLRGAICEYMLYLNDNNWFQRMSANWAIIATLEAVKTYLEKFTGSSSPANIKGKFTTSYWISPVNPISSSAFGEQDIIQRFVLDGEEYIGIKVNTQSTNLPKGFIRDQILFFTDPKKNKRIKLFLCDSGDVNNVTIEPIQWKDGYNPSRADGTLYTVSPRLSISNTSVKENTKIGTVIGKIDAKVR